MAKTNKTKYALLGVLSLMPGSGYDIKKFCDFSISHFWNENYGHIYPVLKQMEAEELVTRTTEHTEGRPDRNVYFITDKGRNELRHWLLQPVEHEPARFELILKIFFSAGIPIECTEEKILQGKKEHEELLERYLEIERFLQSEEGYKGNPGLPFWLATINYGKHHVRAHIAWCIETLAMLKEVGKNEESSGH